MQEYKELTVSEAARYSGFTRFYIYILIREKKLEARMVNQRASPMYLIERRSLDLYLSTSRKHKKKADIKAAEDVKTL